MTHLGVLDFKRIIDKYKELSGIRPLAAILREIIY